MTVSTQSLFLPTQRGGESFAYLNQRRGSTGLCLTANQMNVSREKFGFKGDSVTCRHNQSCSVQVSGVTQPSLQC